MEIYPHRLGSFGVSVEHGDARCHAEVAPACAERRVARAMRALRGAGRGVAAGCFGHHVGAASSIVSLR